MSMRIQLKGGDNLTLISVYAPTMQRLQEGKEQFYEMLGSCVSAAEMDSVIILGEVYKNHQEAIYRCTRQTYS